MHKILITWMCAILLAACGGTDTLTGETSPVPVGGTTATPASIALTTSDPQIMSDGSNPATITALVKDKNNNLITGATVTFKASSGALAVTTPVTAANGAATATLSPAGDPTDRTITVTATVGSQSATVPVDVTGTTLTLMGPTTIVEPGSATYAVALLDAHGTGISAQTVTVSSSNNNTLSSTSLTTDAGGHATVQVTAVNGGADTLKVSALGIDATEAITVSTQNFAFSSPTTNTSVDLGVVQPVTVTWTSAGAPVVNQAIAFSTTRGTLSAMSVNTNSSGQATVNISSSSSGGATITASGTAVSTQLSLDFIATQPAAVAIQASPSTITVGAQSTITAVVRDAQDNLVEGQTVNFQLTDVTGGSLSTGSAVTNNQGVATTIYTASSTTSGTGGVQIKATVQSTTVNDTTTLTVGGKTVFLSLGTGNQINVENVAQYSVTYAVQAIDAAGNGVDGVTVDVSTLSLSYIKGGYGSFDTVAGQWSFLPVISCLSEDTNQNGVLDTVPHEDINNNGKLDPGAVASVTPGSVVTAGGGNATVKVFYPKDHARYVRIRLIATATVQGTQANTSVDFTLPVLAADVDSATVSPPGPVSPYGQVADCSNKN